jgi:hypothetical protein
VPRELRGKVTLITNFRVGPPRLRASQHGSFRKAVYMSLGLGQAPPGKILYIRSKKFQTRRHVGEEDAVVQGLAQWAAAEHPQLNFSAEDVHRLPYAEEVARFADARVMISLWGSSIHNCRYMRPGTLVVELFGALGGKWGDTALYAGVCADSCGLQHVPFGVPGAYPVMKQVERNGRTTWRNVGFGDRRDGMIARIDPDALVDFMRRAFPADPCQVANWSTLIGDFNQFLRRQPNPNSLRPLGTISVKRLGPQFRGVPWCDKQPAMGMGTAAAPASVGLRAAKARKPGKDRHPPLRNYSTAGRRPGFRV